VNFDFGAIVGLGLLYLLCLFGIAHCTERGWIPARLVQHPLVYILSLGVFASSLAFYGVVGLAHDYGYAFLNYYFGIAGFFLFGPLLLLPLQRICRENQLASLADLLTFRFRSQWAGALTALLLTISALPLVALQIKAITDSARILNSVGAGGDAGVSPHLWALIYCITIAVFTMRYGAEQESQRKPRNGLVVAIAFETVCKILAFVIIGCASLWGIFGGLKGLDSWLAQHPQLLFEFQHGNSGGIGRSLMLISFGAAVGMPHVFHMAFAQRPTPQALRASIWGVPLMLLILSLPVLPILWGALARSASMSPEYFPLGIGISLQSPALTALAYIGGLAAASGVIAVAAMALASMCLNHLILPFYHPNINRDIYHWLLWIRRVLIGAIIVGGYVFYRGFASQDQLATLGISGLSAVLQFLPGVLALLFAPNINRHGFIAGLLGGLAIWCVTLFLPALTQTQPAIEQLLPGGPEFGWAMKILTCFSVNILLMIVVSALTSTSAEEKTAAERCSVDKLARPQRQSLTFSSARAIRQALASALGSAVAQREVDRALGDLQLDAEESRPYALRRLRDQIEANLSGLFGATVAHDTVNRLLPYNASTGNLASEDIQLVETQLAGRQLELTGLAAGLDSLRRFYRQTLLDLPMGVCVLGRDREIVLWNRAMEKLSGIAADYVTGALTDNIPEPWGRLLLDFSDRHEGPHQLKQELLIDARQRCLILHKTRSRATNALSGDTIILVEDVTENQVLENELIHSERLASVGRLAAGVAHEIGNPVTGIASLAQNLREESDDPELREVADDILTQTRRIDTIVQTLINFSHNGKHNEARAEDCVSLYACVNDAIKLMLLDPESMPIRFLNNCDEHYSITGNQQRLTQVFLNLLGNARDASAAGGEVVVSSNLSDPGTVTVTVTDSGSGIDASMLEHIFEPFYTTKDAGKGTGLGLPLVYSITEAHGGKIRVESPPGDGSSQGTRFILELPRYTRSHVMD
jgi:signal transduction histidine kinase/Na+/proline symporter